MVLGNIVHSLQGICVQNFKNSTNFIQILPIYTDAKILLHDFSFLPSQITAALVHMFFPVEPPAQRWERQHLLSDQAVQQMRPHLPWIVDNIQVGIH